MKTAKWMLWYFVVLGGFMPMMITCQYAAKVMGIPWWMQLGIGAWSGVAIYAFAHKTYKS